MGAAATHRAAIGRGAELEALRAAVRAAAARRTAFAVIEGEPGIGKTALLGELESYAAAGGVRVLYGAGDDLAGDRPLAAMAEALALRRRGEQGARGELAALLFGTASRDVSGELRAAAADVLAEAAAAGPVLLLLDDVHWADGATLGVVESLLRRPLGGLAVVLARRSHPARPELEALVDRLARTGGAVLALAPLDEAAAVALARDVLGGDEVPAWLRARLAGAGGNPLFVRELAAAARDGARDEIPATLRLAIRRRLAVLDEEEQHVLAVASVLGSAFAPGDLALVLGRPVTELARALRAALRAELVVDAGDRLGFRHDVVREAVYEELPAAVRRALHAQVARALADGGRPPTDVAPHLVHGAQPGDAWAVGWLRRAAEAVAPRAPASACDLLDHALRLEGDGPQRRELLVAQLRVLVWTGRVAAARACGAEALALGLDAAQEGAVRLALTHLELTQDRADAALPHVEAGLARTDLPAAARAQLLAELAMLRLIRAELAAAREAAQAATALGDHRATVLAQAVLGFHALLDERLDDALALLRAATRAGEEDEDLRHQAVGLVLVHTLASADELEEAEAVARAGAERAERLHAYGELLEYTAALVAAPLLTGRWDEVLVHTERWREIVEENGMSGGSPAVPAAAALVAVHRSQLAAAGQWLELAARLTAQHRLGYAFPALARTALLEANGRPREAYEHLAGAWRTSEANGLHRRRRTLGPDLVRLALACGDDETARAVADAVEQATARGPASARAAAACCRGLVERDPTRLQEAAAGWRAAGWRLQEAQALEAAGLAAADRDAAVEALAAAADRFAALGASWDLARTRSRLRALGVRQGGRPASGDALTPAQRRVAELVAEGLTNPQIAEQLFLSRRTVDAHLRAIFRKLGVHSRVELAAGWLDRFKDR